jgi:hypothetical protein
MILCAGVGQKNRHKIKLKIYSVSDDGGVCSAGCPGPEEMVPSLGFILYNIYTHAGGVSKDLGT